MLDCVHCSGKSVVYRGVGVIRMTVDLQCLHWVCNNWVIEKKVIKHEVEYEGGDFGVENDVDDVKVVYSNDKIRVLTLLI